ncbi:hypothetical protein BJ742DRAFT_888419 [Cladochytrium replicatum]|nr:hypothetical protein BJ742DRAFT_888419 [Cladochytrium replicatum]
MIVLEDVPPPIFSDGVLASHPTPTLEESDPGRAQKFLDKLSIAVKEAYTRRPDKIAGYNLDVNAEVSFKSNAVCRQLPENYKLFENKRPDKFVLAALEAAAAASSNASSVDGLVPPIVPQGGVLAAAVAAAAMSGGGSSESGFAATGDSLLPHVQLPSVSPGRAETSSILSAAGISTGGELPKDAGRIRTDAFLYGHPSGSKYRSTNEFLPHLLWLIEDDSHDYRNCTCKLCPAYAKSWGYVVKKARAPGDPVPGPLSATRKSFLNQKANAPKEESPNATTPEPSTPSTSKKRKNSSPSRNSRSRRGNQSEVRPPPAGLYSHEPDDDVIYGGTGPSDAEDRQQDSGKVVNLKRKIDSVEQENESMREQLNRARQKILILRYERSFLFKKLEEATQRSTRAMGQNANNSAGLDPYSSSDE